MNAESTLPMQLPEVVYTPESPIREPGKLLAAMSRDLIAARGLAWRLFVRDIQAMYRLSFFGYLWAFVPPLLAALPWVYLSNQNIVSVHETPIPYPLFVLTGTMLWASLMDAFNSPLKQTQSAKSMLAKINFPREALLLAGIAETTWNFAIRLIVLLPLMAFFGTPLTSSLILAPLGVAALMLLGLAVGLLITPFGMLYGDVSRVITIIAWVGMLFTPVVYPTPENGLGAWLAKWNPASPLIVTTRDWLTGQPPQLLAAFGWVTLASFILFLLAWLAYRLAMPILIERMAN